MEAEKRERSAAEARQAARARLEEYFETLRAAAGPVRTPVGALEPALYEALFTRAEAERAAAPLAGEQGDA